MYTQRGFDPAAFAARVADRSTIVLHKDARADFIAWAKDDRSPFDVRYPHLPHPIYCRLIDELRDGWMLGKDDQEIGDRIKEVMRHPLALPHVRVHVEFYDDTFFYETLTTDVYRTVSYELWKYLHELVTMPGIPTPSRTRRA